MRLFWLREKNNNRETIFSLPQIERNNQIVAAFQLQLSDAALKRYVCNLQTQSQLRIRSLNLQTGHCEEQQMRIKLLFPTSFSSVGCTCQEDSKYAWSAKKPSTPCPSRNHVILSRDNVMPGQRGRNRGGGSAQRKGAQPGGGVQPRGATPLYLKQRI